MFVITDTVTGLYLWTLEKYNYINKRRKLKNIYLLLVIRVTGLHWLECHTRVRKDIAKNTKYVKDD